MNNGEIQDLKNRIRLWIEEEKDKPKIFEESLEQTLKPRDYRRKDENDDIFNIKVTTITGPQTAATISVLRTGDGFNFRNNSVE